MPPEHTSRQWETATISSELLRSDTILAYQGTPPVQVRAHVETGTLSNYSVSLISINCEKLVAHEARLNVSNLLLNYSLEYPTKLPPGYNHYELGSRFKYVVSVTGGPRTSELIMRVFGNTVDADQYISHHSNQTAQNKACFQHRYKGRNPNTVVFNPDQASYYIPTFIAEAGTSVNISYFVTRKYYTITDYVTFQIDCQLNTTKRSCQFKSSNSTEICIIAHYARTASTDAPRLILTVFNEEGTQEYIGSYHKVLILFLWLWIFFFITVVVGYIVWLTFL